MASKPQRSGLALAVLALLAEHPRHPYAMQQLIKQRRKDDVVNVGQRSQLYKTIDRLVRDGLVVAYATERESTRPERTVYTATDVGRRVIREWTTEMLSAPRRDFPEFVAALAHLAALTPSTAADALRRRRDSLVAEHERLLAEQTAVEPVLPRVVIVENEYRLLHLAADISWLTGIVAELDGGDFTWSDTELAALAATFDA